MASLILFINPWSAALSLRWKAYKQTPLDSESLKNHCHSLRLRPADTECVKESYHGSIRDKPFYLHFKL